MSSHFPNRTKLNQRNRSKIKLEGKRNKIICHLFSYALLTANVIYHIIKVSLRNVEGHESKRTLLVLKYRTMFWLDGQMKGTHKVGLRLLDRIFCMQNGVFCPTLQE